MIALVLLPIRELEELHAVGDDFDRVTIDPFRVRIHIRPKPPSHSGEEAFPQIFFAKVSLPSENRDPDKIGTILFGECVIYGKVECADGSAIVGFADLRVLRQSPYQIYIVPIYSFPRRGAYKKTARLSEPSLPNRFEYKKSHAHAATG
jgi:hypothetical protein